MRDERSGLDCYPYTVKEGQQYINLNYGCLFVQQPPKKGKGSRGSFNYYAIDYNRGRQLSYSKKMTKTSTHL